MSANLNKAVSLAAVKKDSGNLVAEWTTEKVQAYFEEAVITLRRLPAVKQKGYFSSWPEIVHTSNERMFQEKRRMRILATPDAITRLDMVFEWITWLRPEERKLIWKRAENKHWKLICWELGCDRTTAWRKWVLACTKITTMLRAKKYAGFDVATK